MTLMQEPVLSWTNLLSDRLYRSLISRAVNGRVGFGSIYKLNASTNPIRNCYIRLGLTLYLMRTIGSESNPYPIR